MIYRLWAKFLTWIGDIYFATKPPKITAKNIRVASALIQAGDVICRKYIYYLDSVFIKGQYSHSGIVVDNQYMIHAIAEGVERIDFIDFIKDCDGFVILRPKYKSLKAATDFASSKVGSPYDFVFNKNNQDRYYCHELTFQSLIHGGVDFPKTDGIIYADDIIKQCEEIYRT